MERLYSIWAIILLIMAGCGGGKQSTDELIMVDVTRNYPKKELILQDFMDVEYIALETTDKLVNQGIVMAIGKEIILVRNTVNDGNIFVYDRTGKGIRTINRKGNGGQEYPSLSEIVLDEEQNEIFVNTINRILVYDLFGNFKRSLPYKEGSRYAGLYQFDRESLICKDTSYDTDKEEPVKSPFLIISKQDGRVIKEIQIPLQQKRTTEYIRPRGETFISFYTSNLPNESIIPYHDNWILTAYSTDTIFSFLPDHGLTPFIVRTPSVQSGNPKAFLAPGILTERYYFLYTEKMEPEFLSTTIMEFPRTNLMYDRQDKTLYEHTTYNDDYSSKKTVNMSIRTRNNEIVFWQKIEADDLFEAYEKGQLKGKLKEIAANVKEEDNPVIMLVKHKR